MQQPQLFENVIQALCDHGYAVVPHFMPDDAIFSLHKYAKTLQAQGQLQQAGTGKQSDTHAPNISELRGDHIHWLDEHSPQSSPASAYLNQLQSLKSALNQALYLGLSQFESHLAIYPVGAQYQRHLDQFAHDKSRKLSAILYLNTHWEKADGGMLRLYLDDARQFKMAEINEAHHIDVMPQGGTLVLFLSERFYHAVLPAQRERVSVTTWFKANTALL